ncbi:hypothetical protein ACU686_45310 [Yinghuangia aomiensis]
MMMLNMDPPEHSRLRSITSTAASAPHHALTLEGKVEAACEADRRRGDRAGARATSSRCARRNSRSWSSRT